VLQTDAVSCKLCVCREVKTGIPAHRAKVKAFICNQPLEEGYGVQLVRDACGAANRIAEEMA
jgi:hypothetical protein